MATNSGEARGDLAQSVAQRVQSPLAEDDAGGVSDPVVHDGAPEGDAEDEDAEEVERERKRKEAAAAALTLEIVGDLPHADVKPPENVLFVCKLNPVTRSDDLELIFSRFGTITKCEVIRDKRVSTQSF